MADLFDPKKNALKNIAEVQKVLKSSAYNNESAYPEEEKTNLFASIFALRMAANAERGKKKSLKVDVDQTTYNNTYSALRQNEDFLGFVKSKGHAELRKLLLEGHGGKAEDELKEYALKSKSLPSKLPARYLPMADKRIEKLREEFDPLTITLDMTVTLVGEIFRTRQAVEAVRGKKSSLEKRIDGDAYDKTTDLAKNSVFQNFIRENFKEVKELIPQGHGGALVDKFKDHVLNLDHIPEDAPAEHLPQALERIDALKKKLAPSEFNRREPDEKVALLAELLGTRDSVDAVRGEKDSLKKPLDPAALNKAVNQWRTCGPFAEFVASHGEEARKAADTGHGGALMDKFKDHVLQLDHIPEGVPASAMPQALARTEAIRDKIKNNDFTFRTPESQAALFAELLGARNAAEAERGKKDSLKKDLDPVKLNEEVKKLRDCSVFTDYIKNNAAEARRALGSGHGGAVEDKFKEHVRNLDHIPRDLPVQYAPTGRVRAEMLQNKLRSVNPQNAQEKERFTDLILELLGTRDAVGAVRGEKKSLDKTLDPGSLNDSIDAWKKNTAFRDFLTKNPAEAKAAALEGHGGALLDKFKDYVLNLDHIPAGVQKEHMPTALERTEALQKKLAAADFQVRPQEEKVAIMAELLGTRRNVGAERGKKETLDRTMDAETLQNDVGLFSQCKTFADFVTKSGADALAAARKGHGGALEDKFKEYVRNLDHIPEDIPQGYLPTALERTEALQKKIGAADFSTRENNSKVALVAELFATRRSVSSERGKAETLDKPMDQVKMKQTLDLLVNCAAFASFVNAPGSNLVSTALKGHGGALEDKFKEHVLNLDHLTPSIPKDYLPTALDRTEALQKKIKASDFELLDDEDQVALYAELLGTRKSVNARRGEKDSLEQTVEPDALKATVEVLSKCATFVNYVTGVGAEDARKAALKGHGGALEDQFKEHVRKLHPLPEDVPEDLMPTALEHTEALQKQIDAKDFKHLSPDVRKSLLTELLASRLAVQSIRGEKDSLKIQLKPGKLAEARQSLAESEAFSAFLDETPVDTLQAKATKGHGGALEDSFRDWVTQKTATDGIIPKGVDSRFAPEPGKAAELVKKNLQTMVKGIAAGGPMDKAKLMKQVASLMILTMIDKGSLSDDAKKEAMTHDRMEEAVNGLLQNDAFTGMFSTDAKAHRTAINATTMLSQVVTKFAENGGTLQLHRNEHQAEHQLEQEEPVREENPPEVHREEPVQQIHNNQPAPGLVP